MVVFENVENVDWQLVEFKVVLDKGPERLVEERDCAICLYGDGRGAGVDQFAEEFSRALVRLIDNETLLVDLLEYGEDNSGE